MDHASRNDTRATRHRPTPMPTTSARDPQIPDASTTRPLDRSTYISVPYQAMFASSMCDADGMDDAMREGLSRLWDEHRSAPFPPSDRGRDLGGVDLVLLDANIAGCASSALAGPLDARRRQIFEFSIGQIAVVLPLLTEEYSVLYFQRLHRLAELVAALDV